MKTIIIGLTGASSSGKSTIACILSTILPNCQIIHEDDFFKPESDVPYDESRKDRDWDCPDAIDFVKLKHTIRTLKEPSQYDSTIESIVADSGNGYYDYVLKSTEPPRNDASFQNDKTVILKVKKSVSEILDSKYKNDYRIILLDGFLLLHDEELLELFDFTLFFKTNYQSLKDRREKRHYTVGESLWVDPPGYFDQFVWPGYYIYHKDRFTNDDENVVKLTGGVLKSDFKDKYKVFEFSNQDNCDANRLIQDVISVVTEEL